MMWMLILWVETGFALGYTAHTSTLLGDTISQRIQETALRVAGGGRGMVFAEAVFWNTRERLDQGVVGSGETRRPYQFSLGAGWRKGSLDSWIGFRYRNPWGDSLREKEVFVQVMQPGVGFLMGAVDGNTYRYGVIRTFFRHEGRIGPISLGVRWVTEMYAGHGQQGNVLSGSGLFFAPYLRWTHEGWGVLIELARPGWEGPVGVPVYTSSDGLLEGFFWGLRAELVWRTTQDS